jgi:hypothetical protein
MNMATRVASGPCSVKLKGRHVADCHRGDIWICDNDSVDMSNGLVNQAIIDNRLSIIALHDWDGINPRLSDRTEVRHPAARIQCIL